MRASLKILQAIFRCSDRVRNRPGLWLEMGEETGYNTSGWFSNYT